MDVKVSEGTGRYLRNMALRLILTCRVCEKWTLEELCEMEVYDMDTLLEYYEANEVPTFNRVRIGDQLDSFGFDGSFGWSCVV